MCIYYMQYIWIVADIPIISPDGFDIVQVSRTYAYIHIVFVMYIILYFQIAYINYDHKKDRQVNIRIFVGVHFSILFPGLHRSTTCTHIWYSQWWAALVQSGEVTIFPITLSRYLYIWYSQLSMVYFYIYIWKFLLHWYSQGLYWIIKCRFRNYQWCIRVFPSFPSCRSSSFQSIREPPRRFQPSGARKHRKGPATAGRWRWIWILWDFMEME